jgi:hypothetical protein
LPEAESVTFPEIFVLLVCAARRNGIKPVKAQKRSFFTLIVLAKDGLQHYRCITPELRNCNPNVTELLPCGHS